MAASLTVTDQTDQQQKPMGDEATPNDQSTQAQPDGLICGVEQDLVKALQDIRLTYEISWSPKRRGAVQRTLKAFEFLKNNPYSVFQYDQFEYNPILAVLSGQASADDLEMYANNDNVYQMLALSFIAVGTNNQDKTRYMPINPQNEEDLKFSDKASMMQADIERRNDTSSKSKLELLNLWCAGSYFSYVRNVVDAERCGTTKEPVMGLVDVMALPNRYVCSGCGNVVPQQHTNPFTRTTCDACQKPLGQSEYYPEESMSIPMQVGEQDVANSMTAIDIYNLLYIEVDPDALELRQSPLCDLKTNTDAAAVRACYPAMYQQIVPGMNQQSTGQDSIDQIARDRVTSPNSVRSAPVQELRGVFSRCWFQPWSFNQHNDPAIAERLKQKFPKGCKLVTWGNDLVLEVTEERMLDHWSWCGTIEGLGLYPFGIGDVAINIQERINNAANNVEAYMDRLAFPNVLADVDAINVVAMNKNPQGGGQFVGVKRVKNGVTGSRDPLENYLWQPTYHVDSKLYDYGQQLILLAQLLTGIQPQIFGGGTTRGVDTASGQQQQLNTAMGRLMLFFSLIRSEHAIRSRNAVKCMARNIIGSARIVVPGDVEDEWKNEFVLESDVQGDFEAYPESDQGFPASYEEMRDRLQTIFSNLKENPLAAELLNDPDNAAIVAKYLLPDGIRVPDAAARNKIKAVLQQLSEGQPIVTSGPTGQPINIPSIQPDPDFDNMDLIVSLSKIWANDNYKLQVIKPLGFENVRAYFRLASQYQAQQKAQSALQMNNAVSNAAGQPGAPQQRGAMAA